MIRAPDNYGDGLVFTAFCEFADDSSRVVFPAPFNLIESLLVVPFECVSGVARSQVFQLRVFS